MSKGSRAGGFIGVPAQPSTTLGYGIWGLSAIASFSAGSTTYRGRAWPAIADASFASVVHLCHYEEMAYNGSSNGRVQIASSTAGNAPYLFATATGAQGGGLSTQQSKFGLSSWFNNNGVCIPESVEAGSEYTFGTGDFTVELFFRTTALASTVNKIFDFRSAANVNSVRPVAYIDHGASDVCKYFVNGADVITGTTAVTANAWHFFVISRVSGSTRMYLDAAQEGSTYTDSNNYLGTNKFAMGNASTGTSVPLNGFFDEVRITKGVGRYSGTTLTVPTAPFPDY